MPLLEKVFRKYKRPVGMSWRMDETYIKVKGVWKYLYRAVDKEGKTVDFLLTAKRDQAAAKRFFDKAIQAGDRRNQCQQGHADDRPAGPILEQHRRTGSSCGQARD